MAQNSMLTVYHFSGKLATGNGLGYDKEKGCFERIL